MKKKLLVVAICLALLVPVVTAFADEGLLSPSGDEVTAGEGLGFKVNLESISEEEYGAYTLTVKINPSPEKVSVKENVNVTMNQVNGTYTVSSSDLTNVNSLNFTVYPDSKIKEQTPYEVTATVASQTTSVEDSFTFIAIPAEKKDGSGKGDKKLPGGNKKMSMKKSVAVSTVDSSLVYTGSADNYLDALSVSGYKFTQKFNKTRDTYFLDVPDDVTSVSVSATASDSSADVDIAGNRDVSKEMSKIQINVTADNGDVRVYRIYVTHSEEDK